MEWMPRAEARQVREAARFVMTRRALVVEDDTDIGRLIDLQLAEFDCESHLVTDGVAGL